MANAYDAAYPNLAAILAKHPQIVAAYTDGPHAYTAGQVARIRAAGAAVLANHERAVDQLLAGASGGAQAAADAMAAVRAWGMPADGSCSIVYSVDLSVGVGSFPVIGKAFDAINAVHAGRYLAGCYGEGALIDYLVQTARIAPGLGWLSASSSFPGFNPKSPNVGLVQQVGTDVAGTDLDTIMNAVGLHPWWPDGLAPLGGGALIKPLPTLEDGMYLVVSCSGEPTRAALGIWAVGSTRTHIPNPGFVPVFLDLPGCANVGAPGSRTVLDVAPSQWDALMWMAGEANPMSPSQTMTPGAASQALTLLADPAQGVVVTLAHLQALLTAVGTAGGASVDVDAIAAKVRAEIAANPLVVTIPAISIPATVGSAK